MYYGEEKMRRGLRAGLFTILGLAILFSMPSAATSADWGNPQLQILAKAPVRNGDIVTLQGTGFQPNEILSGFGAIVQIQNEEPHYYQAFNLPDLGVNTDPFGQFSVDVHLDMLRGIRGYVELALCQDDIVAFTDFLQVHDNGPYQSSALDATTGDLFFDDFPRGGSGEDPVVNDDDVPLTSESSGGWAWDIIQVNLERYTTTDATGSSTPVGNITHDVTLNGSDLASTSSAVIEGLSATYKSVRMTILVWDTGYLNFANKTTTGTDIGEDYLSAADVTNPEVSSAVAIDLTTIVVTFSENVSTPSDSLSSINNWTVTFGGAKEVTNLAPRGSSSTATCTLTVADLGDRGATPTVQFTTGSDEFEDAFGNDCASTTSPHITATDGIAPATPTLNTPTAETFLTGASVSWTADAGSGTDTSLESLRLKGSDNGSDWTTLDTDLSSPYSGSYTFGTEWVYYAAEAVDTEANTTLSSATGSCQDAHHLDFTTTPASTAVNVESGEFVVTVEDNYGNAETVTETIGLSTESTAGNFRAEPGGDPVGSINIVAASTGSFYYIDSDVGTHELKTTHVTLYDDSTDYVITAGAASKILIKLPGQSFSNGVGITGTPDFSVYGGNGRWALAGTNFGMTLVIVDADNNLVQETGSRNIDFTTNADDAPDGSQPTCNSQTFPYTNISIDFDGGFSTSDIVNNLKDFTVGDRTVYMNAAENGGGLTGENSTYFGVLFDDADHIGWVTSSGAPTTTPVSGTITAGSALPDLYVAALDQFDNVDTTYTGSTITTAAGTLTPPTNSPAGKGQGGTSLPNGNTAPDYGSNSTWSNGIVTLDDGETDEKTVISAASATGFRIRGAASGGGLAGEYTDDSNQFAVDTDSDNYLRIEDTSGGGGTEYVDSESFTTDDDITFWSISYDQWGNTIGNYAVTWNSTNLTPEAGGINSNHWDFSPTATTAGNGTLEATNGSVTDRTISSITVTSGSSIASIVIRTATGGGGDEVGALEIAGAANGGSYNVTATLYAAGYNADVIYVSDVSATWSVTGTLPTGGGSGFSSSPATSTTYTAVSSTDESGTIKATYNALIDETGTVTVDATEPATVQDFDISEHQNNFYVTATWDVTSSYDDGSSAGSGNVEDFDIKYSASIINDETTWDAATTVPADGKPSSFNSSGSWNIYMASVPAGYYYYAIKTMDPQGYWSDMGSGCYTTSSDYSLPVTLSSFLADGSYGRIYVNWSTESEVDALGFRLLRDSDPDFPDPILVSSYQNNPDLVCQGSSESGFDYSYTDRDNLVTETIYYYRLETVDINGAIEASSRQASAEALPLPSDYSLGPNFPNPFNPVTHFELQLPQDGEVSIIIYDSIGREVTRILDNQYLEANVYQLSWNGTNLHGHQMPSGLYFCRLQAENNQRILKMLLLK
ncbi:hypothetical protein CEE37_13635 [candidate division LCP-89 bacterium B3_LCP]|uniref:FlgD Ig-like domain-containing protein n=1 Tax=candidate division LCP-89 bacterium B3_LCP TaxID=2012998 RepID=A0A532URK9_UNCL8|nr:MAG: hypothetical protein CEE37_13635 [candidate division LCP-89 bacterium B3_LCP]